MIIYSNWLVPGKFGAMTAWPFIFVKTSCKGDAALIEHEMVHYREQEWITPWWFLKYAFSKTFRIDAEARAYKTQIASGALTIYQAAWWLTQYDSSLTIDVAIQKLS